MHRIIYSFNYRGEQQITAGLTAGQWVVISVAFRSKPKRFKASGRALSRETHKNNLKIVMRRTCTQ
jgi:hypothetical protein